MRMDAEPRLPDLNAIDRLLEELLEVTALEIFSSIYATVSPWDALTYQELLGIIEERCVPFHHRGRWQTFRVSA